ncbi:MAG: head decoration protein [Ruminococcaceae bacterium]|nr:head decoration protein [Oscillospiraceae bacterium]
MSDLYRNVGEMNYDGLISDLTPRTEVRGGTIAALEKETVLKRGTILSKNADGKLIVLGSGEGTVNSILCDDVTVGASDVETAVYTAGCFDLDKTTVADDYTITAEDIDALRKYGIVFKNASDI